MRHLVFKKLSQRALTSSSILYSRPVPITVGENIYKLRLNNRIERIGYRKISSPVKNPGEYSSTSEGFEIFLNGFNIGGEIKQDRRVVIIENDAQGEITAIRDLKTSRPSRHVWIEPEFLSDLGNSDTRAVTPKKLSQFGKKIARSIISIEDERFYSHLGLDPTAILRAIYTNIKFKVIITILRQKRLILMHADVSIRQKQPLLFGTILINGKTPIG